MIYKCNIFKYFLIYDVTKATLVISHLLFSIRSDFFNQYIHKARTIHVTSDHATLNKLFIKEIQSKKNTQSNAQAAC